VLHALKIQHAKITKKSPSAHHHTTLSGYIFAIKACIDNRKKPVKQQYLPRMSPQYGELEPTNGRDQLVSLRHPSKFQRGSCIGFITAPMSLNRGQPNFPRCLAISRASTLYIHFGGFLPLMEFFQVQNSLSIQVFCSSIGSITTWHSPVRAPGP